MPITRYNLPADLEPGLNAHFGRTYNELPDEWPRVFDTETSNRAFEEDQLQTGFGVAPRKPEGSAIARDQVYEGWKARYNHETYALAFAITEEALEDNLYERQGPRNARALARAMKHAREIDGAAIFNNGFDAAHTGGDGVSLFSAAHPTILAGDQSNILATPADLSEAALEDLFIQIRTTKDDRGLHTQIKPVKLIIPPALMFEAHRILASMGRVGTSDNDTNAIRDMGLMSTANVVVMTRLTDDDAWYIKTDAPEGLKHMSRIKLQRGMDRDFNTGNHLYKARERRSFGWSEWRSCFASSGAA